MHRMSRGKATHSDKLERWLGSEKVAEISGQVKDFYWPIPVHGVPGKVFAMPGGDFAGEINVGAYFNKEDAARVTLQKIHRFAENRKRHDRALHRLLDVIKAENRNHASIGAFTSVDAVISAFTGAKGQSIPFNKVGTAPTAIAGAMDMWTKAGFPAAGSAGAAAPGGTACSVSTTGAMRLQNVGAAGSMHYLNMTLSATVINNSLMLIDRLFSVVFPLASGAGTETAVTGVPTRYQSGTAGNLDYIGGNFMVPVNSTPTTALAATAHNWDAGAGAGVGMRYTDQDNNASDMPLAAGLSACAGAQIDLAVGNWFAPLASGDIGVKNIINMSASAAVATGSVDWIIAHPIAILSCPIANLACLDDGLYTSLNLTHIEDSACLCFFEFPKPATTATTYSGLLRVVGE